MNKNVPNSYGIDLEWHPTPGLWIAYRCGCSECPKGYGQTQEEAVADLEEHEANHV